MQIVELPSESTFENLSVLRMRSHPVDESLFGSQGLTNLATSLFIAMYEADGAGLAAPQVGIALRLAVIDPSNVDVPPMAMVNPELVEESEDVAEGTEGCLSLPGRQGAVRRSKRITVSFRTVMGMPVVRKVDGWLARVVQHEIDHLDGKLYIDRMESYAKWVRVQPASQRKAEWAMRSLLK